MVFFGYGDEMDLVSRDDSLIPLVLQIGKERDYEHDLVYIIPSERKLRMIRSLVNAINRINFAAGCNGGITMEVTEVPDDLLPLLRAK